MTLDDLNDDQLLAYLDGEADLEVVKRIEKDSKYKARLEVLSTLQDKLLKTLKPLKQPSSLDLGEYHLGLLPTAESQRIEAYLAQHPHAAHHLDQLEDFLAEVDPFPKSVKPGPIEQIKIMIAELIQSGGRGAQPVSVGIRGELAGIYQVDDIQVVLETDVDLDDPTHKVLVGLVQGTDATGLKARLLGTGGAATDVESTLDEFGNFMISGLTPGLYHLVIQDNIPSLEVHIQELQV